MDERKDRLLHRVHIVEGLLRVLDDRLEFMALLSSGADKQAARDALVTDWGMMETQVAHALDMPLVAQRSLDGMNLPKNLPTFEAKSTKPADRQKEARPEQMSVTSVLCAT